MGQQDSRLIKAMHLLDRAAEYLEDRAPDKNWWRDYFELSGKHAILTDEGWEPGSVKQSYLEDAAERGETWAPIDEVNAPK